MHLALGLPNYRWKLVYENLDTRDGQNTIKLDAMDPSRKVVIKDVKPQRLRSEARTPLGVIGRIRLATQIGQQANDTGFFVVKNFADNVLLSTTSIDANVKSIALGKRMTYPVGSRPVAIKSTDPENISVAPVGKIEEHPVCCQVAKIAKIPAILQVPVLVRAPATGH